MMSQESQEATIMENSAIHMERDNFIHQMAVFDLSAPHKINIILDDSDDDNDDQVNNKGTCKTSHEFLSLPVIEKEDKIEQTLTNNIKSEAIESLEKQSFMSDCIYLIKDEEDSIYNDVQSLILKDKVTKIKNIVSTKSEQSNNRKRKLDEKPSVALQSKKVQDIAHIHTSNENKKETVVQHTVSVCNSAHVTQTSAVNKKKISEQINDRKRKLDQKPSVAVQSKKVATQGIDHSYMSYEKNKETVVQQSISVCNSGQVSQKSTVTKIEISTQTNPSTDVLAIYISNLLQSLSEYIIRTLEIYCWYNGIKINPQTTSSNKEAAWNHFQRSKNRYFDLSYSTVVNLILPQENNHSFINSFLEDTLKLSHIMNKPALLDTQIRPLFLDLKTWVKNRHRLSLLKERQLDPTDNQFVNENPAHSENKVMHSSTMKANPHTLLTSKTNKISTTASSLLFSSGPPWRQISITAPVAASCQPQLNSSSTTAVPTQNVDKMNLNNYNFTQQRNLQGSNASSQRQNDYQIDSTLTQSIPSYSNKCYIQNINQSHHTNVSLTSSETCRDGQCNAAPASIFPVQSMNDQLNIEPNRSVSTDSGFQSPLHFNCPTETTRNQVMPFAPSTSASSHEIPMPVIEHITSLHPQASFNTTGTCCVCGRNTNKLCVGCYKRYYCSYECQRSDWQLHILLCK